jgi:hypothetical protein
MGAVGLKILWLLRSSCILDSGSAREPGTGAAVANPLPGKLALVSFPV